MELHKVTSTIYDSDYKITVTFNNGSTLICDLFETLQLGVFRCLQDITKFKEFSISDGVIAWPSNLDIAPEYLFKIGVPVTGSQKLPEPDYVSWIA